MSSPQRNVRIAFINQKGGVGKTTLALNCAVGWARRGFRVLLIDLDPQAHLTLSLSASLCDTSLERIEEYTIEMALRREKPLSECIFDVPTEGISLVPSHIDLAGAEGELSQELGRELLLRDALDSLEPDRFDLILFDCPPSLGLLSLNALAAADEVLVPVQAEYLALQGMAQLIKIIELVQQRLHPQLQWNAVVPTMVDPRTNLSREVVTDLREHFPDKVTTAVIPSRVKVAEAPSHGTSIFGHDADGPAAREIEELCRELQDRLSLKIIAQDLAI
ncbi:MAG: ParA family protein [Planctomycetota bacterium]